MQPDEPEERSLMNQNSASENNRGLKVTRNEKVFF